MNIQNKQFYRKIACSQNNSAAISENGEVYIWGRGKNGLISNPDLLPRSTPSLVKIQKNKFDKVIHIAMGQYHMLALIENQIVQFVNKEMFIDEDIELCLEKQRQKILLIENGIDIFEFFDKIYTIFETSNDQTKKQLYEEKFISLDDFLMFIQFLKIEIVNDNDYKHFQKFYDLMQLEKRNYINIFQYYYLIHKTQQFNKVISWGVNSNGRLGLTQEQIIENTLQQKIFISPDQNLSQQQITHYSYLSRMSILQNIKNQKDQNTSGIVQLNIDDQSQTMIVKPSQVQLKSQIIKVSTGFHHSLALDFQGMIWSWGSGGQGCLGIESTMDQYLPIMITQKGQEKFQDVECGAYHNLAIAETGNVYSWGQGQNGQLGHGEEIKSQLIPKKISFLCDNLKIKALQISAGDMHSAIISESFELYTFGSGSFYKLGHGQLNDEFVPKKIVAIEDIYVLDVSCGTSHTICLSNEGFIYSWGSGSSGKLGIQDQNNSNQILPQRVGQYLKKFRRQSFYQVCAGPLQSFALTANGKLYTWGSNQNGILGLGNIKETIYLPQKIIQPQGLKYYLFKQNEYKQLQSIEQIYYFKNILSPQQKDNAKIKFVACGENNTFFLTQAGKLYASGTSVKGLLIMNPTRLQEKFEIRRQLQNDQINETVKQPIQDPLIFNRPIRLKFFNKNPIGFISCSYNHIIAITSQGRAYSWGANQKYQLGLGFYSEFEFIPKQIKGALETKSILMCCCLDQFSLLLTLDGEVWSVGTSENGVGGLELKSNYLIQYPKMINDIPQMIFFSASASHVLAISSKFDLYGWGSNIYGQLGLLQEKNYNNQDIVYTPQKISLNFENSQIISACCGDFHSVILNKNGELFSCGIADLAGQINYQNQKNYQSIRVQDKCVKDFTKIDVISDKKQKFVMIASSQQHTMALTEEGKIYGWGNQSYGKLGEEVESTLRIPTKLDEQIFKHPQEIFSNIFEKENQQQNLGNFQRSFNLSPQMQLNNQKINFIACGLFSSSIITNIGNAYICGSATNGRLGIVQDQNYVKNDNEKIVIKNMLKVNVGKYSIKKEADTPNRRGSYISYSNSPSKFSQKSSDQNTQKAEIQERKTSDLFKLAMKNRLKQVSQNELNENSLRHTLKFSQQLSKVMKIKEGDQQEDDIQKEKDDQINQKNLSDSSEIYSSDIQEQESLEEDSSQQEIQNKAFAQTRGEVSQTLIIERTNKNESQFTQLHEKQQNEFQDEVQRLIYQENPELNEKSLVIKDQELQAQMELLMTSNIRNSYLYKNELMKIQSRIEVIIFSKSKMLANQKIKQINLQHIVPNFVLQNIQIYETFLSILQYHPCYILSIIESQLLSKIQIKELISILYKDNYSLPNDSENMSNIISLCSLIFKQEMQKSYKINSFNDLKKEFKNIKIGSIFWQIYVIVFKKQLMNMVYIQNLALLILNEFFAKRSHQLIENEIQFYQKEHLSVSQFISQEIIDQKIRQLMGKALELNEESFQDIQANQNFYNQKCEILINIIVKFQELLISDAQECQQRGQGFITKELAYLHLTISKIYQEIRIEHEKQEFQKDDDNLSHANSLEENELIWKENEKILLKKLEKETQFLILNLYIGIIIHVLQNFSLYNIDILEENQDFLSDSNNINIICNFLEKFFCKEELPYLTDHYQSKLSNYLQSNRIHPYLENSKMEIVHDWLQNQGFFYFFISQYQETIVNICINRTYPFAITLQFLFTLHNLICNFQSNASQTNFFILGEQDPIYILFKQFSFKHIPIDNFDKNVLNLKLNLQVNTSSVFNENCNKFYKCQYCYIILPVNFLRTEQREQLQELIEEGWQCSNKKCKFNNKFGNQLCQGQNCSSIIPENQIILLSYFIRYIPKQNQTLDLYLNILKQIEPFKNFKEENNEGLKSSEITSFYQLLQKYFDKEKKKLQNIQLLEGIAKLLEQLENPKKELSISLDQRSVNFQKEYLQLRDIAFSYFKNKQKHKQLQIYIQEMITKVNIIVQEKLHQLQQIITDNLIVYKNFQQQTLNIPNDCILPISNALQLIQSKSNMPEKKFFELLSQLQQIDTLFGTVGLFTYHELLKRGVIREITFKGKIIPEIVKQLKFYIFSKKSGGFLLNVVYIQESFFNIFIEWVPELPQNLPWNLSQKTNIYFNELSLVKCNIEVKKYIELKRTANYKPVSSFGSANHVLIKINVFEFVQILQEIESQLLSKTNATFYSLFIQ